MRILALEFSSVQRSVAVVDEPEVKGRLASYEVVETGGQATKAMGMIDEALRQAHVDRKQIERVVVGLGPGSYTGIRAAIALAQGWQLATGVKLLGISSAECIAAEAHAQGMATRAAVVIDAQRGEFYLANYELGPAGWREVRALRLADRANVKECHVAGEILIGPEVTKWFPEGRVFYPRAARLGQLASGRTDFVPGEKLEPIYLRQTAFVKAPPPRSLPSTH